MPVPPTRQLPAALYGAEQVRALDRHAIDVLGIPGLTLMERAGAAVLAALRARWPGARRLAVLCGGGNNGGDGYVIARLAHEAGLDVTAVALSAPGRLGGDAAEAHRGAAAAGVPVAGWSPASLGGAEVLVDAMLGTGLDRAVAGAYAEAIDAANAHPAPCLAVDIPSGLASDSGAVLGTAVRAAATVSFIGLKRGLFTGAGPAHAGTVLFHDLGAATRVDGIEPAARLLGAGAWRQALAPRPRDAHKGTCGRVLVVGGDAGYGGAPRLAALGAARSGAGLVTVATHPEHAALVPAEQPEIMGRAVATAEDLAPVLARADVIACGPGLGTGAWGRRMLAAVQAAGRPLVLDADGLNLLAEAPPSRRGDRVLTPHPGEAARLLGTGVGEVQGDRYAAAAELQARYGGVVVLKGAGTVVAGEGVPGVCPRGNPGMASGGMGDLLTGIIAGLAAQRPGESLAEIAALAVCLHGAAADRAAAGGERGLLATDLLQPLRRLVNP